MGGKETVKVKEVAERFPSELKRANKALDDDLKRAILVLLVDEGGLSFAQIQERLSTENDKLHQGFLSEALKDLQNGAIIKRVEKGDFEDRYEAEYRVTDFGHKHIDFLFRSIEPLGDDIISPAFIDLEGEIPTVNPGETGQWEMKDKKKDTAKKSGEQIQERATEELMA